VTIRTQKTGRVQILPLAKPLLRHIETLPAGDDPQAPLCPSFQGKNVSWLSNQFFEIMASAGLVQSRGDHQKKDGKAGRGARRQLSDISFHALRHTATSLLKNAGVSLQRHHPVRGLQATKAGGATRPAFGAGMVRRWGRR
jgi:integrase